jgi:hypothetical protein
MAKPLPHAMLHGRSGLSGVDWDQALKVGYALLLSPVVGFVSSAPDPSRPRSGRCGRAASHSLRRRR